jgi:hypothetical protein
MAGAMRGTFVAALLTMSNAAVFDSPRYIALMVLVSRLCSRQRLTAKAKQFGGKAPLIASRITIPVQTPHPATADKPITEPRWISASRAE